MDGGKVALLNEEVVMLVEHSQHFDEFLRDACGTRGVELLTTKMVGKAFEENFRKIWSLIERRGVSSIGIYGMGGVGKTALAKCINNQLLKQSQVRVFWIAVSREFTIKGLQDKIASFLGVNLLDEDDEDIRAARLHRALSHMKNSILILDDLWEYIDLLKVGCPVSVERCRLIITTRSLEVCSQIRCQKVIAVKILCEDEAWKLFIETLTPGEEIKLGPHVEEIAKSVARLCGGLLLGILTVAGRMRGMTSIHSWTTALAELMESLTRQDGIGDDEVFRVLKYSFDQLNPSQNKEFNLFQLCFLYCSLYPQSYVLHKDELVERFITEGLVGGRKSRRAQIHHGRSILDKLVNACLLETYDECVKMPDPVRCMALKICRGKYMARTGDYSLKEIPHEHEWTKDVEKMCLMLNDIRTIRDGTSPNCPKLSTLLLQGSGLESIPNSFFSKMKRLSALDLCNTHITMLPDSLCNLKSLESLLLENCAKLETVPYLGKLKALRELNLSYTAIEEVPHGLEELFNLTFLSIAAPRLKMLPRGLLPKLEHLQYLKFPDELQVPIEEIECLKEVEQLYGRLDNVHAFNLFIKSRQCDALYQVQVGHHHPNPIGEEIFGGCDREVYLFECNLEDEKVLGNDIEGILIKECEGLSNCLLDDFSPLNYPKSLKILEIQRCGGIECVLTSDSAQKFPSRFPTLEFLELEELEDFKRLIQKGELSRASVAPAQAVFSSLRRLRIGYCNMMKKLGLSVVGAPNLTEIHITECEELQEIFEDEGRGCVALPKLQELELVNLPKLKSLCKAAMMVCNSINTIVIISCPLMKIFPVHFDVPLPPSLKLIDVQEEWWESLEWYNRDLPRLLQPFVDMD